MITATALYAEALAAVHAAAFPPGERWDARAMVELLGMPGAFGFIDARGGLLLARSVAGETEILTLAVIPKARRMGIGRSLLRHLLTEHAAGPVFLEVAGANAAALSLYHAAGFQRCGRRPNYYGPGRDALLLRRLPNCASPGA